jgi:hypothetical protein
LAEVGEQVGAREEEENEQLLREGDIGPCRREEDGGGGGDETEEEELWDWSVVGGCWSRLDPVRGRVDASRKAGNAQNGTETRRDGSPSKRRPHVRGRSECGSKSPGAAHRRVCSYLRC